MKGSKCATDGLLSKAIWTDYPRGDHSCISELDMVGPTESQHVEITHHRLIIRPAKYKDHNHLNLKFTDMGPTSICPNTSIQKSHHTTCKLQKKSLSLKCCCLVGGTERGICLNGKKISKNLKRKLSSFSNFEIAPRTLKCSKPSLF